MVAALSFLVRGILDVDEVEVKMVGDKTEITVLTSSLHETLARLKMRMWSIFEVPVKIGRIKEVKEVQRNPAFKRYQIVVEVPTVSFRGRTKIFNFHRNRGIGARV